VVDFLLLAEDYLGSYTREMETDPKLRSLPYEACKKELFSKSIYYGDAYEDALSKEGFRVEQLIPACRPLRLKWAAENNLTLPPSWTEKAPFRWWWTQIRGMYEPKYHIGVTEQLKKLRPKILWVFSGAPVTRQMIKEWRPYVGHIILWWSCPLNNVPNYPFTSFDAIFSCIPSLVEHFKAQGVVSYHLPHAFDPRVLSRLRSVAGRIPKIAFVGNVFPDYMNRISFLDRLSRRLDIDFYGNTAAFFPEDSPMRSNWLGEIWGDGLYSEYGSHLFAIHVNIDVAEKQASAKRLFEATGMGACLLTDSTGYLEEFFEPDKEVVTFSTVEECVDKVKYLLNHPMEAAEIGKRGQERTLKDHNYTVRSKQLIGHLAELRFI